MCARSIHTLLQNDSGSGSQALMTTLWSKFISNGGCAFDFVTSRLWNDVPSDLRWTRQAKLKTFCWALEAADLLNYVTEDSLSFYINQHSDDTNILVLTSCIFYSLQHIGFIYLAVNICQLVLKTIQSCSVCMSGVKVWGKVCLDDGHTEEQASNIHVWYVNHQANIVPVVWKNQAIVKLRMVYHL